jgi:hypothetical protein
VATSSVTHDVTLVSGEFRSLANEVRSHVANLAHVVKLSEDVLTVTDRNRRKAEELSGLIEELNAYARTLGNDYRELTVPAE